MRETTRRPTTRSRSSTTDVTEEFSKLCTKLTNSQQQVDRERGKRHEESLESARTNTKLARNKAPLSEKDINTQKIYTGTTTKEIMECPMKKQTTKTLVNKNTITIRGQRTDTAIRAEERGKVKKEVGISITTS
ncbi:hypothetical protein QE152_g35787 [Popillia japonica]|uniref:Uncharacterized protein n=1 Tax=Popillia japonica TaxID=7064 RepID=A0AAW1IF78_POPJA